MDQDIKPTDRDAQWQIGKTNLTLVDLLREADNFQHRGSVPSISKEEIAQVRKMRGLSESKTYALAFLDTNFDYLANTTHISDLLNTLTPEMIHKIADTLNRVDCNHWVLSDKSLSLDDIDRLRDKKESALKKKYHVSFSTNENVNFEGDKLSFRRPELYELVAVEQALKHSYPAYKCGDEGIKFYFLNQTWPGRENAVATHEEKFIDGKSAIVIEPSATIGYLPTEAIALDYLRQQRVQRNRSGSNDRTETDRKLEELDTLRASLEFTIRHELAHNTQYHIGWFKPEYKSTDFYNSIGWIPKSVYGIPFAWLKTKDGRVYESVDDLNWRLVNDDTESKSIRTNLNNQLNANITNVQPETVSSDWLRRNKYVEAISNYFPRPTEQTAEAIAFFRGSTEDRKALLDCPNLYKEAKQLDQEELNKVLGVSAGGTPKFLRDTDSTVKPYSANLLKRISKFEKQ